MLKNVTFSTIIIFAGIVAYSQNLVPNSSFENYLDCPVSITHKPRFELIPDWNMPTMGTSDYYNKCSYASGVPKNTMGYLNAHSGNAYAGILTMLHFDKTKKNNSREYIQAKLITKLRKGEKYYIEFYYALANSSKYTTDKIGMYLSDIQINSSDFIGNIDVIPQIESETGNFVKSREGWVMLRGNYIAKGNEQYIIIGNFRNNAETLWESNPSGTISQAYFYIDDVRVYSVDEKAGDDFYLLDYSNQELETAKDIVIYDPENEILTENWYTFNTISFDFDKAVIKEIAYPELDNIVKTMIINPQLNLLISGHTDKRGTPDYNLNLSRLRAEAIAEYIIKNGIPGKRVHTIGYGSKIPLNEETGNYDIEKNRRVEFMFY